MKKRIALLVILLLLTAASVWSLPPTPPYSLPSQTGNSGKFLTTDGTVESWGTPSTTSTALTVASDTADATSFPVFVGAGTGDQAPKTNAGFTFDAVSSVLGATGLVSPTVSKGSGETMAKATICSGYVRATATETLTYPSITSDMVGCKARYVVQGAYTLSIDVPGTVTPTLNGTALAPGQKVANSGFSGEAIDAVIVSTTVVEFTSASGVWIDGGA